MTVAHLLIALLVVTRDDVVNVMVRVETPLG